MKHTEIEAIFTAKVAEFISNGYTINATTMSGSQGEIAKIDFRKGDEIIRVMLATDTEWTDNGTRDMVKFTVGRSTENLANDNRPFDTMGITFWNNRMEIIEERRFYRIDNRANFYTEDVAEYDEMRRKQYQRYRNRDERRWNWRNPDRGTCSCGETVTLENQYYGACQCTKCGQWYNLFGEELLPPEQWDMDPNEEDF